MRGVWRQGIVVLACVVAGCGGGTSSPPPDERCTSDDDCGSGKACDDGVCVTVEVPDCEPPCAGPTPLCRAESRTCVRCLDDGTGCSGAAPFCDPSADGGLGACVACRQDADCGDGKICEASSCLVCTATRGCASPLPICDPAADDAVGRCVVCREHADCASATPVCLPDDDDGAGRCVACATDDDCPATTPACDASADAGAGRCVECVVDEHCDGGRCDPAARVCVECLADADCPVDAPRCDPASLACAVCTATEGCGGATPFCDLLEPRGACVACRTDLDCEAEETCTGAMCVHGPTSLALQQLQGGSLGPVTVDRAYVTVLIGEELPGTETPYFFVQAGPEGPGFLVRADPADLVPAPVPGDRVHFSIWIAGDGSAVLGEWAVLSGGHPLAPLAPAIPPCKNHPRCNDCAATIRGEVGGMELGGGDCEPIGLLWPPSVYDELGISRGSDVTLRGVVHGRYLFVSGLPGLLELHERAPFRIQATKNGYTPRDFEVVFNRHIDPTSLDPSGAQFTVDPDIGIFAAEYNPMFPDSVLIRTGMQEPFQGYVIGVDDTMRDLWGFHSIPGPGTSYPAHGVVEGGTLEFSEIHANMGAEADLVELRVSHPGMFSWISLAIQGSTRTEFIEINGLDTYDSQTVIVLHIGSRDRSACDETYSPKSCAVNFPNAVDLHVGEVTKRLPYENQVLLLRGPNEQIWDAVPLVVPGLPSPPAAYLTGLAAMQAEGWWSPADCGGAPCSYSSTPSATEVAVDWSGMGSLPTGASLSKKVGASSRSKADWNAVGPSSFGRANP